MCIYLINVKGKEEEVHGMKMEISRLNKAREAIQRRLQQAEEGRSDVESQRDTLKIQIAGLERGFSLLVFKSFIVFKSMFNQCHIVVAQLN